MYGLSIVVAALSFMGAPASLPVDCNPQTTAEHGAFGLTWHYLDTDVVTHTDYNPTVCAGLTYMAASVSERIKIRKLNADVDFERDEGIALLTVLHESYHAAGHHDETETECAAMKALPTFVQRYVPVSEQADATGWANGLDKALGPTYHTHPC